MSQESLADALARCFLAGDATVAGIERRCAYMLGRQWHWLGRTARRYLAAVAGKARQRQRDVAEFILSDHSFERAWFRLSQVLVPKHLLTEAQRMQPVAMAAGWNLPRIESAGELADWFWLDYGELDWFADSRGLCRKTRNSQLRHYYCRVLKKDSGGIRLIEAPKRRLKAMQRQILEEILDRVPAHEAAHGFVKGRSILTFATPHVSRPVVLRMDLQDFFPSFSAARIRAFFRTLGYPESVADLLGGICTTSAPIEIRDGVYSRRHLPQGAPSSPSLANLCAYRLDCRLAGLAKSADAVYTRYADDLAFSGDADFASSAERFSVHVASILLEEGFAVQHRKTRVMRQGVQQHLAGLVTNQRLNVRRTDFDRLKATLTNCVRHGPASQNRESHPAFESHLNGRIGFVEMVNPAKGKRLREIFERIQWQ